MSSIDLDAIPHFIEKTYDQIETLSYLAVEKFVENYLGDPIPICFNKFNQIIYAKLLDVEHPLDYSIDINNDYYWKKYASAKIPLIDYNKYLKKQHFPWKNLGLAIKLVHLIENTLPEKWDANYFNRICIRLQPLITRLKINQLKSKSTFSIEIDDMSHIYKVRNYDEEYFDHGNLEFIGKLNRITHFTFSFGEKDLDTDYHPRYFKFSRKDIESLAIALSQLPLLRLFKIHQSILSSLDANTLIESLYNTQLVTLDLSFCKIEDFDAIEELLKCNETLKYLEFRGNLLNSNALLAIGKGLKKFKGTLIYLGLSRNPLKCYGFKYILDSISQTEHVKNIDLSGIDLDTFSIRYFIRFLGIHAKLESIDITAIEFTEELGDELILSLIKNKSIREIKFKACHLTFQQEIEIINLLRNIT